MIIELDSSIKNLFSLYDFIYKNSSSVELKVYKDFQIVSSNKSSWPNFIYRVDFCDNNVYSELRATAISDTGKNILLAPDDVDITLRLRQEGFFPIDRWLCMSLDFSKIELPNNIEDHNLLFSELFEPRAIKEWVEFVSSELFGSNKLNEKLFEGILSDQFRIFCLKSSSGIVATSLVFFEGIQAGIYMVAVKSSERKKGFGRRILSDTLSIIQLSGAKNVVLQSTRMGVSLYEHFGFVKDQYLNLFLIKKNLHAVT